MGDTCCKATLEEPAPNESGTKIKNMTKEVVTVDEKGMPIEKEPEEQEEEDPDEAERKEIEIALAKQMKIKGSFKLKDKIADIPVKEKRPVDMQDQEEIWKSQANLVPLDVFNVDQSLLEELCMTHIKDDTLELTFNNFLNSEIQTTFLISGPNGCGKSAFLYMKCLDIWEWTSYEEEDAIPTNDGKPEVLNVPKLYGEFVCVFFNLSSYTQQFGDRGFLHSMGIEEEVFKEFIAEKKVLLVFDDYELSEMGAVDLIMPTSQRNNFLDGIIEFLAEICQGVKVLITCPDSIAKRMGEREIAATFLRKNEDTGKYDEEALVRIEVGVLNTISDVVILRKLIEKHVRYHNEYFKMNFMDVDYRDKLYAEQKSYIYILKKYSDEIIVRNNLLHVVTPLFAKMLMSIYQYALDNDLGRKYMIKKQDLIQEYIFQHYERRFTELNIAEKLKEKKLKMTTIIKDQTLSATNYKEVFNTICMKFIVEVILDKPIIFSNIVLKKDNIWKDIFDIEDDSLQLEKQPFYQILLCLPQKIMKDFNQNYYKIIFMNEFVTAYFFASFFHSFTDKMYFTHKYNDLVKLFKTSRLLTTLNLSVIGYNKDDLWLLTLSRWYKVNNDTQQFENYSGKTINNEMKILNPYDENLEKTGFIKKIPPVSTIKPNLETVLKFNKHQYPDQDTRVFGTKKRMYLPEDCIFGSYEWKSYLGQNVRPNSDKHPVHLLQTLEEDCSFWFTKDVSCADTHFLVYIPKTMNGEPFTLALLKHIIENPKDDKGEKIYFNLKNQHEDIQDAPIEEEYWLLMTKDIIPRSNSCDMSVGQKQIETLGYDIPYTIEVIVCMLALYIRFKGYKALKGDIRNIIPREKVEVIEPEPGDKVEKVDKKPEKAVKVNENFGNVQENTLTFAKENFNGKQAVVGCFDNDTVIYSNMFDNIQLNKYRNFIGLCAVQRFYPERFRE